MSWDAGAISNYGALTFPSSEGGGGTIPSNLTVSSLTASVDISSNAAFFQSVSTGTLTALVDISGARGNFVALSADNVTLRGQPLQYVYGGFASTSTAGFVTVNLPFAYSNINYQIIANYADPGARIAGALDTYGLMGIPNTASTFDLVCQNPSASYNVQYTTCGTILPL